MSRKKARRRSIPRQVRDDVASRGLTGQVGAFPGARVALAREVRVGELGWVLSPPRRRISEGEGGPEGREKGCRVLGKNVSRSKAEGLDLGRV